MVEVRYSDELGGLSGLDGSPGLSGNCYFQQGGLSLFADGRTQVDMGGWTEDWEGNLSEWQTLTSSDTGSIEIDPQLNDNYIAGGSCAGKGYSQ